MKQFLIIAAIAGAAYYFFFERSVPGAYADDGTPLTYLFVTEQCGRACTETRRFLKRRKMDFEEYDAFSNVIGAELYKSYGGEGYLPYVVIGEQRVWGHQPGNIISAVAIEFGPEHVKPKERKALARNFDRDGDPRVVMYMTSWCGYCNQARDYFVENRIPFVEFNIETDRSARRDYDALQGSGTPLLYNGYARLSGFDRSRIESDLGL